jgi:dTMP kinase
MSDKPGLGKLIVICGIDGCGKTTQEELLVNYLRQRGLNVATTKQPTDWYRNHPVAREYLQNGVLPCQPETLGLLAATDRMLHIETEIRPLLNAGTHVICNRYVYSTYAFFAARGADMQFIEAINCRVPEPDLGILLTIDPEVSVRRVRERDASNIKFEERDARYLQRVQDELMRRWPKHFFIGNGEQDKEVIFSQIVSYIEEKMFNV